MEKDHQKKTNAIHIQTNHSDPFKNLAVTIRNVKSSHRQITQTLHQSCVVQKGAFLNYFGMQRFGSKSNGTHRIGLAILKHQWKVSSIELDREKVGEKKSKSKMRISLENIKKEVGSLSG